MVDAARSLYDSLTDAAALQALIGRPEDLHLEVKVCDYPVSRQIRGYISQALSGFANSDGGVFVLGLSTKRGDREEPDVITGVKPFAKYENAASDIRGWVGQVVMPVVDGVLVDAIPSGTEGYGYVKMLIPESEAGPHRAMVQEVGAREYWKRSGHSFYRMEHFDVADMFGRRRRPRLRLDWRAVQGSQRDLEHDLLLGLMLINEGRGVGRYPLLEIEIAPPLRVWEYGIDGNRNHGLRWRPLGGNPSRHAFTGETGQVVHPGVPFDVTVLAGPLLRRRLSAPWEFHPPEVVIPYRVAAEDAPVRDDVLRFKPEEELERIKRGLGL